MEWWTQAHTKLAVSSVPHPIFETQLRHKLFQHMAAEIDFGTARVVFVCFEDGFLKGLAGQLITDNRSTVAVK
jgi:hypothetical protein